MNPTPMPLQKIAGFESTAYATLHGELVWTGEATGIDHPRNLRRRWQPPHIDCDSQRIKAGAHRALGLIDDLPAKGLLLWLMGRPLPFPLQLACARFDAIRDALERDDLPDFAVTARRVLGLGAGLTPSGDDFVGGICFALAHAPRRAWAAGLPAVQVDLLECANHATNVISAALLGDKIAGASYAPLHELLAALQTDDAREISAAMQRLLRLGASSGADMLAGVLLALTTTDDD